MTSKIRAALPALLIAALSSVLGFATGLAHLGDPLRLVDLLTIFGLAMTAGVSWAQAVTRYRQEPSRGTDVDLPRSET